MPQLKEFNYKLIVLHHAKIDIQDKFTVLL